MKRGKGMVHTRFRMVIAFVGQEMVYKHGGICMNFRGNGNAPFPKDTRYIWTFVVFF